MTKVKGSSMKERPSFQQIVLGLLDIRMQKTNKKKKECWPKLHKTKLKHTLTQCITNINVKLVLLEENIEENLYDLRLNKVLDMTPEA